MEKNEEKYIINNEYVSQFRKKTLKAVFTVLLATAAVAGIMILLAMKTEFLYHTDFFKVKAAETVPLRAEKQVYTGEEYEFSVEDYVRTDGIITLTLNISSNEAALNRLSTDNFKLICYDYTGVEREEIVSAAISESEITSCSEEQKSCCYKLEFHKSITEETADDICCLRINTGSSDGVVSILCNYNTEQ